ncbi:MAG: recombination regulator RecX [Lachnospiraceae bacterium]|jgi:regulatory protein|nr:recombination regulator RecX [Lachnospiraceae bacterium]
MDEKLLKKAKLRAMHILERMDRSEASLREKLACDGYEDDIVAVAVDYVKSFGYINDENYAKRFVENNRKNKSALELYHKLIQKGISKDVAENAVAEFTEDEDAIKAIKNILQKRHYDYINADEKEKKRQMTYLSSKGFMYDDIKKAMAFEDEIE